MVHRSKRPTPVAFALAGGLFAIGTASVIARAIDNFTPLNILPPFHVVAFALAVVGVFGGGSWLSWLSVRTYKSRVAVLEAENAELRAQRDQFAELLKAVQAADEQGERNFIRLGKGLDLLRQILSRQIADEDTQDIPRLHSINGGGGA